MLLQQSTQKVQYVFLHKYFITNNCIYGNNAGRNLPAKSGQVYAAGHRMLKVFLYRARVGSYRAVRSDGDEKGNHLHRKNFGLTTTEIWNELISSDMKNGSLLRKKLIDSNDATFKPDHQNNRAKHRVDILQCTHFDHIH